MFVFIIIIWYHNGMTNLKTKTKNTPEKFLIIVKYVILFHAILIVRDK